MDSYGIYCETSRVILALANVFISVGLFTQCWRLYRTKNTKTLTPALFASLALHRIVQMNYGIAIQEWPIMLASAIALPPIVLIAIGYWRYRANSSGISAVVAADRRLPVSSAPQPSSVAA